jgi:hypothetical protein
MYTVVHGKKILRMCISLHNALPKLQMRQSHTSYKSIGNYPLSSIDGCESTTFTSNTWCSGISSIFSHLDILVRV